MLIDANNFAFKAPNGFIVLEGVNGAGKTTLQDQIVRFLQSKKLPVIATREPGATKLGEALRPILLCSKDKKVSDLAELFLFAADRAEHVQKVIKPAIHSATAVISDRYYYSTLAFQGYGRGFDLNTLKQISYTAIAGILPDFVILLDLDPQEGLKRAKKRGAMQTNESDGFEEEQLDFHRKIREGFLQIAKESAEPFVLINAMEKQEKIFEQLEPLLQSWIKR